MYLEDSKWDGAALTRDRSVTTTERTNSLRLCTLSAQVHMLSPCLPCCSQHWLGTAGLPEQTSGTMWVSSHRRVLLGDVLTAWWHYLRTAQWSKAHPTQSFNSLLLLQVPPLQDSLKAPFSYSYSLPLYPSQHFLNKSPGWLTLPG